LMVKISQLPAKIWFDGKNLTVLSGTELPLNLNFNFDQSEMSLSWMSSDPSVATVKDGILKTNKAGITTVTVRTETGLSADCEVRVLFKDVSDPLRSFYEPVYWALDNGITTGKTPTTFAPFDNCTRAQFVTFLWRQQGSPEPTVDNPFKDIEEGKSYSKAVVWAYEKGITTGTSDTEFSPFKNVTRGQVATFLYRASDKPVVTGTNPFNDVPAGLSYTDPVIWMVENNITTGKSPTTFDPNGNCTRGQTVTFLYRTYTE